MGCATAATTHTPVPYTHTRTHTYPPQAGGGVRMMVGPADLQASLLGRFRRLTGNNSGGGGGESDTLPRKTGDRPTAAKGAPPAKTSGGGGGKAVVEELRDVGQKLSRFTAAVLAEEEEKKGSSGSAYISGGSIAGGGRGGSSPPLSSSLKGLPKDFLTRPLSPDEATVRGASAVVRGLIDCACTYTCMDIYACMYTHGSTSVPTHPSSPIPFLSLPPPSPHTHNLDIHPSLPLNNLKQKGRRRPRLHPRRAPPRPPRGRLDVLLLHAAGVGRGRGGAGHGEVGGGLLQLLCQGTGKTRIVG